MRLLSRCPLSDGYNSAEDVAHLTFGMSADIAVAQGRIKEHGYWSVAVSAAD